MPITSIQQVLDQLDGVIFRAENEGSRLGYFAALYRRMTLAVQQGLQKKVFADGKRMEKLDVCFALRYLNALQGWQSGMPVSHSWKMVFEATRSNSLAVIQHLMLGVNTHINLDLAIAAAQTCPAQQIYDLQPDYNAINQIIASLVSEVQDKLSGVWWPLRMLRDIVNDRQDAVINFSIEAARKAAWANAVVLANAGQEAGDTHILVMDNMVAGLGQGIMQPGHLASGILRTVRWMEYNDVKRIIGLIR